MKYTHGGVAKNTLDDFWAKVDVAGEDDCWLWTEAVFSNGYGRFKRNYRSLRAHRVALEAFKGPLPVGKPFALHTCNERKCVNPKHLYWGDHQDNMRDRRVMNYKPAWNNKARQEITVQEWEGMWRKQS